jgi:glycosyltransferase involved in cell wall biosynthesis
MIKVGFIGTVSKEWMGGLNYYRNLFFALDTLEEKKLQIFVFVGKKTDNEIKKMFTSYATVIEDSLFDQGSVKWYFAKIIQYFFNSSLIYANFFRKYSIQILSHTSLVNIKHTKIINWIPDFQHIHLPEMFSLKDVNSRNTNFKKLINHSDLILLSSYDALKDFIFFSNESESKVRVLQFVSQPDEKFFELKDSDRKSILDKYSLPNDFFYMPNQLWKHKNHLFVFQAINELKQEGVEICVVCSGHLNDYRNRSHIEEIKDYINSNNLQTNIRLLGLIDYQDVFALIKFSKAVINPSLFEGWSSTVEECKSVNKKMILSDLDVHFEQYPSAQFFIRDDLASLKNILRNCSAENIKSPMNSLPIRTQEFAEAYVNICLEVMQLCID